MMFLVKRLGRGYRKFERSAEERGEGEGGEKKVHLYTICFRRW